MNYLREHDEDPESIEDISRIGYGGVLCIETGGRRRAWAVPAGASSPLFRSSKT